MKRGFGSDNHSGTHPLILNAIVRANEGHEPSYGTDDVSRKATAMMKEHFGDQAETHFVFNGTAANVLALSTLVQSHHAVIAAAQAHVLNDECGAVEKNVGCKIISIPTLDGKLTPLMIKPYLIRRGDQHFSQVKAITITQPTELSTVYSVEEIRALGQFARENGLGFHIDGARLVNAAEALGVSFREMLTDTGVDVVSVGGTKNGLLFGEAVVLLKPKLSPDFKFVRKQMMQLPSKTRFIAAQFLEFLGTDLWRKNANHANALAQRLYDGLKKSKYVKVTQVPQANAVFVIIPKALISPLRDVAFFYVWDEASFECRLMTTWDTSTTDIDDFVLKVETLGDERL